MRAMNRAERALTGSFRSVSSGTIAAARSPRHRSGRDVARRSSLRSCARPRCSPALRRSSASVTARPLPIRPGERLGLITGRRGSLERPGCASAVQIVNLASPRPRVWTGVVHMPVWTSARALEVEAQRPARVRARRERWGAPAWRSGSSELRPGAGRHHRRAAGVDGGDDRLGVDSLQVDGGRAEVACPSWRWMMFSGTPSRASSRAWARRVR